MPQETNLNVSPYFDDFDSNKNYYKVLFKPGYPIQARELNNVQSISQNQIEQFGKHIFKEGSVVIPGQLRYENPLYAVQIEPEFNGLPISLYFNNLLGAKIRGASTGVTAEIVYLLDATESEKNNYTLYVKYLQSGGENFDIKIFSNSETLILETPVSYGSFTIQSGQGFCNTLTENATSEGSAVSIANGVYFARGTFVNVNSQTILLDQYGVNPSYKVGFQVLESIVNSDEDESLFDNAQGFSNYAAPGADRFKIELILSKKDSNDDDIESFIEIMRVRNGIPQFFNKNTQYNLIRDELARRTFDESGNYFVVPFTLFVRDSLNDRVLTNGLYFKNQRTIQGNNPSEDMMVYEIGPGKAYVQGYDVETISSRLLDVPKPRVTETVNNQVVPYNAGNLVVINNSYGSPYIGLGTDTVVSLMDSRIGSSKHIAAGTTIGLARVYDFIPESDYIDETSRLHLRLFDIQTYTKIGLSTSFTTSLTTPCFIKGKKSGAKGYLKDNVTSGTDTLTLYETTGNFLENEQIIINGIDNGRLIKSVTDYSLSDVKSIYSQVGITTFNSDLVLSRQSYIAKPGTTFNINNGVVSAGLQNVFTNIVKVGDIVSYANTSFSGDPIYNKVTSVGTSGTSFTISSITSVPGICNGSLPSGSFEVTNIIKISSSIDIQDSSLLTKLYDSNVSSVNLEGTEVTQRRLYNINSFNGYTITVSIDSSDVDVYFDSFDEDKFMITYSDGSIEPMRSDKYNLDLDGKRLTFRVDRESDTNTKVITTVKNLKANPKNKKLNKASSIIVYNSKLSSSGIGTTTINDGLTYSQVYGTRVQDEEISLNVPDVVRVLGVFESSTTSDPSLPTLQITGNANNNSRYIIGEQIEGQDSGAVAIITGKIDSDKLEYVYLNTNQFSVNELIIGSESLEESIILNKTIGDNNITQNFAFDDGQRDSFYDFSRIIRKESVQEPKRKLKIVFQNYTIDSTDTGEFISASSYTNENFKHNVPYYKNSRLTDFIDIRPRVAPYTLSSNSPFEFDSRNFASDGQYSKYTLAPGENLILSYSYYVGRVDRVFLNSDGTFEVVQGNPDKNPLPPPLKNNALDIATIFIPPFVYDTKNVTVDMSQHKRYRMSDISLLEDRIQRVEKYTTLSMLESKTENFVLKDAETGLDRFKCGFFVDNFSSHEYHDIQNLNFKSCIDTSNNTLRPLHYTTSLDLQLGSEVISGVAQTFVPNKDHSYVTDLGSPNIRKTGDLVTLDYDETLYFEQIYATKTESITPFLVKYWTGTITLNPPSDSWVDERSITNNSFNTVTTTITRPDQNITITNNQRINREVFVNNPPIVQTGIPPFDWITNARNILSRINRSRNGLRGLSGRSAIQIRNNVISLTAVNGRLNVNDINTINQLLPPDIATQFITQINSRIGGRTFLEFTPGRRPTITESRDSIPSVESRTNINTVIVPEEVVSRDTISESTSHYTEEIEFLRSRNIEFDVKGLRPVTRFYTFFQGIDVKDYIVPKLLEIEMISGRFQIGETVESDPHFTGHKIVFRLCKPNHRTGPFDGSIMENFPIVIDSVTGQRTSQTSPTTVADVYKLNPYTQQPLPENYTESSTVLNVDTRALELPSEVEFYGRIAPNMRLIGKSSGAVARISNIRLVSDNNGRLIGSLFIPDPNVTGNPKWINGKNSFIVIDSPTLENVGKTYNEFISNTRTNESSAQSDFSSSGITNVTETNILTTRNITILSSFNINTRTISMNNNNGFGNGDQNAPGNSLLNNNAENSVRIWEARDPLAQSFYVTDNSGIFLTSVEVYFETKDESIPVTLQIRPMIAGVPSNIVVPFSEVTLSPDEVNLSTDGSVATRFVFSSPVYLPGPQQLEVRNAPIGSEQTSEFSVVLLSSSPQYRVFISELGFNDIETGVKISAQPTLGSLFKSQNGTTWSPSQLEDLKYKLYRANFVTEGLVRFFNPKLALGNKKVTVTGSNQFLPLSKRIIVGLGSTGYNSSGISTGITIQQGSATGKLIGVGGSLTSVIISNVGTGYTPSSGSVTFNGVVLESETGYGLGAIANIGVTNSEISSVTITSGGNGYQIGDSLIIPEKEYGLNVGFGGKLTVSSVSDKNNLFILDNVQGNFTVGINTLTYINSIGSTVSFGATIGSIIQDPYYDGLHMKVNHMNHGMHSSENYVEISEFRPSEFGVKSRITSSITNNTLTIPLVSSSGFETFEGNEVSPSNPGYAIIGNEVIKYTSASGNVLTVSNRGVDGTQSQPYDADVPVYKYEFNGISLRRINKVHNFAEVDIDNHPIELDSYYIKIDNSDKDFDNEEIGIDRTNNLYFTETVQSGESGTLITNNIQFEALTPNVSYIIPSKTNMDCRIRTFTGTSISGNEKSFSDDGFKSISLDETTYFDNPKLICSEVNENRFITESPGNRSFTMEFLMSTNDSRVSPVIDLIKVNTVLTSNLVNSPVGINEESNYANDDSVRDLYNDKHSAIYISKPVRLKIPANSLKVLLSASHTDNNDIRILYRIFRDDSPELSQNYELFPGYKNYQIDGQGIKRVIDKSQNDGSSDTYVRLSSDRTFYDYEYSVDDLPDFTSFSIKIVMASENQAIPPIIKQLRAIATTKPKV